MYFYLIDINISDKMSNILLACVHIVNGIFPSGYNFHGVRRKGGVAMRTAAREADSRSTLSPESGMWVATAARHASHYYLKAGPHLVCTRDPRFLEYNTSYVAFAITRTTRATITSAMSRSIAIIIIAATEMRIHILNILIFAGLKIWYKFILFISCIFDF